MKHIDDERLRGMIKIAADMAGSQKAFAAKVGISQSYLSAVLNGRREAGAKILQWFGLERVVSYRRLDGGEL